MLLMIVPAVFFRDTWLPAVMTCIITVSQYGFGYSYLPYDNQYYIVALLFAMMIYGKNDLRIRLSGVLLVILVHFFIVELLASAKVSSTFLGAFVAYLIAYFINNDNQAEKKMSMAFVIASFTLSLMYIMFRDNFLVDYSYKEGLERADWIDPNYFSLAIGMGAVVSLSKIYDRTETLSIKVFCIATIVTSIMSIALLASRGGLIAFSMATLVFVLFSKGKILPKIIIAVVIVAFVVYLFNNNYFDLMLYRFGENFEEGSGRVDIWKSKIQAWSTSNIFSFLFGYGITKGASLTGVHIGFHNDFLAVLIEYGILGFFLFMSLWFLPIRNILKNKRNIVSVSAFMLFLTIGCFTLEPFTLGRIPFWMFYIFIILLSENKHENKAISKTD